MAESGNAVSFRGSSRAGTWFPRFWRYRSPTPNVYGHARKCPLDVCAVTRRRFPVGASPTRQPLPPEATGAVVEVTKWLEPSV